MNNPLKWMEVKLWAIMLGGSWNGLYVPIAFGTLQNNNGLPLVCFLKKKDCISRFWKKLQYFEACFPIDKAFIQVPSLETGGSFTVPVVIFSFYGKGRRAAMWRRSIALWLTGVFVGWVFDRHSAFIMSSFNSFNVLRSHGYRVSSDHCIYTQLSDRNKHRTMPWYINYHHCFLAIVVIFYVLGSTSPLYMDKSTNNRIKICSQFVHTHKIHSFSGLQNPT